MTVTREQLETAGRDEYGCLAKGCRCQWHSLSRKTMDVQMLEAMRRKALWNGVRVRGGGSCTNCGAQPPKFYMSGSKCKACTAIATRERTYSITPAQQEALLTFQHGKCGGCTHQQRIKSLALDHRHFDNVVRGLLCQKCNVTVGEFHDDAFAFLRIAMYLVNSPARAVGIGDPPLTDLQTAKVLVDMMKLIWKERDENA